MKYRELFFFLDLINVLFSAKVEVVFGTQEVNCFPSCIFLFVFFLVVF